jgi:hypothetical protein
MNFICLTERTEAKAGPEIQPARQASPKAQLESSPLSPIFPSLRRQTRTTTGDQAPFQDRSLARQDRSRSPRPPAKIEAPRPFFRAIISSFADPSVQFMCSIFAELSSVQLLMLSSASVPKLSGRDPFFRLIPSFNPILASNFCAPSLLMLVSLL